MDLTKGMHLWLIMANEVVDYGHQSTILHSFLQKWRKEKSQSRRVYRGKALMFGEGRKDLLYKLEMENGG